MNVIGRKIESQNPRPLIRIFIDRGSQQPIQLMNTFELLTVIQCILRRQVDRLAGGIISTIGITCTFRPYILISIRLSKVEIETIGRAETQFFQ